MAKMRTIIAGSRTITSYKMLLVAIRKCGWVPTIILCGDARGADKLGEEWAKRNNVPVEHYPADWDGLGKKAGYVRNSEMVQNADALIALWDGNSKGTEHTIHLAKEKGLKVYVAFVI